MPESTSTKSVFFGNLAVFFTSLVIVVVCVELVLQFVPNPIKEKFGSKPVTQAQENAQVEAAPHPQNMYSMINDYHWRLTPDSTVNFKTAYYDIQVQANSHGIRDARYPEKAADVYRVLGLGDSFAFGWGVSADDSFYKQLQARLSSDRSFAGQGVAKLEVINAGIPGYGTYEALEILQSLAPVYSPDMILLAFYEGNDYLNNSKSPRKREISQGYLKDVREDSESGFTSALKRISVLYSAMHGIFQKVREKRRFTSAFEKTKAYLVDMKAYADEINAPFHVFIIPDQDPEFYSRSALLRQYDKLVAGMNLYDARDKLLEFGKEKGIGIQVLSKQFEDNAAEVALHKTDAHFNEKGHALAAEEMFFWIRQESEKYHGTGQ